MNKQELIAKVAKDIGGTKSSAALAIDSVIDGITRALRKGDSVTFVGFGTFKTSNRKARTARNPQTGEAMPRVKRGVVRRAKRKKLAGLTKGYFQNKSKLYKFMPPWRGSLKRGSYSGSTC